MDFSLALTLFVGALGFGASGCLIGCMPILSPFIASRAAKNESMKVWIFSLALGRIFGYASIAAVSFFGFSYVKSMFGSTELISKLFGSFVVLVAVVLFVQAIHPFAHKCGVKTLSKLSPFGVGVGLSFSFCPAVLQLVAVCAATQNIAFALLCGVIFGIGVSAVPTLFYGFALYPLIKNGVIELIKYKKTLEIASALMLAVAGTAIFFRLLKV